MAANYMRTRTHLAALLLVLSHVSLISQAQQQPTIISVDTTHPGAPISPSMFGIFFEDINFGADGGLYPELVKNRSFEFSEPLTGWHEVLAYEPGRGLDPPKGEISVHTEDPLNPENPHYLRVRVYNPGYAFYNVGFRGIGVEAGAEYRFSAYVRAKNGGPTALHATITDATGKVLGSGKLEGSRPSTTTGEDTKPPSAPTPPTRTPA